MTQVIDFVNGVQDALTTGTNALFQPNTCFWSFAPEESLKNPPSDQFAVAQPTSVSMADKSWAGAGKINYIYRLEFVLHVYVRLATDEAHREDLYLQDTTYGSIALVDSIIGVFQDYVNTGGFGYELDNVSFPNKDRPSLGWSSIMLHYHSDYQGRAG